MLYDLQEGSDGMSYGLLSSTDRIEQGDIDAAIGRLRAAGIWDWNIDDICDELEKSGIEAVPTQVNKVLWV